MPLIMFTEFQINQIILTLFSGVWNKNPTPVAEKIVKCHGLLIGPSGGGWGEDFVSFGTGVLMSSNFLRPPNNQTNSFKDPK